jgi:hypothetical protein
MGVKKLKKKMKRMRAWILHLQTTTYHVEGKVHKLAHTTHEAADGMQAALDRLRVRVHTLEQGVTYTVTCVDGGGGSAGPRSPTSGSGGAFWGVGGHHQTATATGGGAGGGGGNSSTATTLTTAGASGPPGSVTITRQVGEPVPEDP